MPHPDADGGPIEGNCPKHAALSSTSMQQMPSTEQLESMTSHFEGLGIEETPYLTGCTDCLVCGKLVKQIKSETECLSIIRIKQQYRVSHKHNSM